MTKRVRKILIFILLVGTIFSSYLAFNKPKTKAISKITYVMALGDYQASTGAENSHTQTSATLNAILDRVNNDYSKIHGLLSVGDYSAVYTKEDVESGLVSLNNDLENSNLNFEHKIFVQGNHDPIESTGLSPSGANDPANEKYGVFTINEDDYMWGQGANDYYTISGVTIDQHEGIVKNTASRLKDYLDAKLAQGFNKPIFITSHLALNYSLRTYKDGDSQYARYIFDVVNNASASGLNIIFIFGHNHSHGWDNYLGGANVYLEPGDTMPISVCGDRSRATNVTLNFTYMNAGYVGYYKTDDDTDGANRDLSVSVFEITDNKVVIKRYSANGLHDLKSKGVYNTRTDIKKIGSSTEYITEQGLGFYVPDTRIYSSTQIYNLNQYVVQNGGTNWDTSLNYAINSENFSNRKIILNNPLSDENKISFMTNNSPITMISADFKLLGKVSGEQWGKIGLVFTNGNSGFFFYMDCSGSQGEDLSYINGSTFGIVRLVNGIWDFDNTNVGLGSYFDKTKKVNLKVVRERNNFFLLANEVLLYETSTDTLGVNKNDILYPQIRSFQIKAEVTNYINETPTSAYNKVPIVNNRVLGDTPYKASATTWDLSSAYEKTSSNYLNRKAILPLSSLTSSNELFFNTSSTPQVELEATFKITGKTNSEQWGKFGFSYTTEDNNGFFFYVDANGDLGTDISTIKGTGVGVVIRENGNHNFESAKSNVTNGIFNKNNAITLKLVRNYSEIKLYANENLIYTLNSEDYGIGKNESLYGSIKSYGIALEVTNYDCIGTVDYICLDGDLSDWKSLDQWEQIDSNKVIVQDYQNTNKYSYMFVLATQKGVYVYAIAKHETYLSGSANWWENNNFEFFFNGNSNFNQFFASSLLVRGFNSYNFKTTGTSGNYTSVFEGFIGADTLNLYASFNGIDDVKFGGAFKIDNGTTREEISINSTIHTSYWTYGNLDPRSTPFSTSVITLSITPVTPPSTSSSSKNEESSSSQEIISSSTSSQNEELSSSQEIISSSSSSQNEESSSTQEILSSSTPKDESSSSSSEQEITSSTEQNVNSKNNTSSESAKKQTSGCGASVGYYPIFVLFMFVAIIVLIKVQKN